MVNKVVLNAVLSKSKDKKIETITVVVASIKKGDKTAEKLEFKKTGKATFEVGVPGRYALNWFAEGQVGAFFELRVIHGKTVLLALPAAKTLIGKRGYRYATYVFEVAP